MQPSVNKPLGPLKTILKASTYDGKLAPQRTRFEVELRQSARKILAAANLKITISI